jgi:hypothetical protein
MLIILWLLVVVFYAAVSAARIFSEFFAAVVMVKVARGFS